MNRILRVICFTFLLTTAMMAQSIASSNLVSDDGGIAVSPVSSATTPYFHPFSRFGIGGTLSPLGIGAEFTTNVNPHLNLRATGSFFGYTTTFGTNGFAANAQLKLASARTSLDVYPFHSGFRISPGVMFYNQNRIMVADTVAPGASFTLNDDTFYSANANSATGATPVNGTAFLNLHATRPAFAITGGWGNPVARGHWSFPFEVGVGFLGTPALSAKLNGWACYDQAQTQCMNLADLNNPIAAQVQNDLQVQLGKWNQDLEPLKTYPIVSAGVAYSFHGRSR